MATASVKDDYLRAAEVMAKCGTKYAKYAIKFLERAGLWDEELNEMLAADKDQGGDGQRGRKRVIDPDFIALLNEVKEKCDGFLYQAFIMQMRRDLNIQQSRIDKWMTGDAGISDEVKEKVVALCNEYLKTKANEKQLQAEIMAAMHKDREARAKNTSP